MEELIKEIEAVKRHLDCLQSKLSRHCDGFIYFTCLRSYGSVSWLVHSNQYTVQTLCDEYYSGYDGIVDVYTNNPDNTIDTYGDVNVMALEELKKLSKKNVSMSRAITNMIGETL